MYKGKTRLLELTRQCKLAITGLLLMSVLNTSIAQQSGVDINCNSLKTQTQALLLEIAYCGIAAVESSQFNGKTKYDTSTYLAFSIAASGLNPKHQSVDINSPNAHKNDFGLFGISPYGVKLNLNKDVTPSQLVDNITLNIQIGITLIDAAQPVQPEGKCAEYTFMAKTDIFRLALGYYGANQCSKSALVAGALKALQSGLKVEQRKSQPRANK